MLFVVVVPSETVPSPQSMCHFQAPSGPGSVKPAVSVAVEFTMSVVNASGELIVTTGATFAIRTICEPLTVAPAPVAVIETVDVEVGVPSEVLKVHLKLPAPVEAVKVAEPATNVPRVPQLGVP